MALTLCTVPPGHALQVVRGNSIITIEALEFIPV